MGSGAVMRTKFHSPQILVERVLYMGRDYCRVTERLPGGREALIATGLPYEDACKLRDQLMVSSCCPPSVSSKLHVNVDRRFRK